MTEIKDLLALLAGVNMGLLAAALTLLAVYPAIGGLLKAAFGEAYANEVMANSTLRQQVIWSLKWSIISTWCALLSVIALAGLTFTRPMIAPMLATAPEVLQRILALAKVEIFCGVSGILTLIGMLLLGLAARRIFQASEKTA